MPKRASLLQLVQHLITSLRSMLLFGSILISSIEGIFGVPLIHERALLRVNDD